MVGSGPSGLLGSGALDGRRAVAGVLDPWEVDWDT